MVSIQEREIKDKKYTYLVKSIRLANGKGKTIEKMIDKKELKMNIKKLEEKYKEYFMEKEENLNASYAAKNYQKNHIFSAKEIEKIEIMKTNYRYLLRKLDKATKKDVFDRFTVNFTYNSNAIEGNSLTLKDVNIIMFESGEIKTKDPREIYETRNSRELLNLILKKQMKIIEKDIIKMHKILMRDIDERLGYKKVPNIILGNVGEISTTKPENVEKEMKELISWYNNEIKTNHPLQVASIFHGKFEKIHPFADGNGRVGRFIINSILVNNGYPPLIIRKTLRESYISALQAFDNKHKDNLERFMLEKFKDTYRKFFEVYIKYI
ncbi:MAG: Fic family protein [Candidatus Aenigmarchaeota archaeon]|nr:Fic family protein [Candidatus Aenigmarchaeota archaeon]